VLRATERLDAAALRWIAERRTGWLTDVATAVDRLGAGWALTILGTGMVAGQIAYRRWRHLFTFVGSVFVLEAIGASVYTGFSRPRPYEVTTIGRWAGYSMPSPPVGVLAAILVGVAYTLVVPGRPRRIAKVVIGAALLVFAAARLYLGVDHPFDVLVGTAIGVAIPLAGFRLFTPSDVFPVAYGRGKTAHLDVGGARGAALRRAVSDQLGLTVVGIEPVGLAGSGGSTPLRLTVAGDPETHLFAKLFAMNHVRADRWYKLGRTILYGRLEDEAPFQSVRRLVEYEDYALRLLRDMGLPTAEPYGIVEITPTREYLLVTEFFDGAREIGDAEIDDGVIDEGLAIVRQLWDAGLAHRDIKPANLMVRDGHLLIIDVFFVQVRPSPWRQAVDLANMMLVLAVRTDAHRVHRRALRYFTPDEIADAFASARGVASPTQLRSAMKLDGRDLLGEFRRLAPERRPIALQRWSIRRVLLALGVVAATAFGLVQTTSMLRPAHDLPIDTRPDCGTGDMAVLMAQSVPTATAVPCIASLPVGWDHGGSRIRQDRAIFWLDSEVAGPHAVEVTLRPTGGCDVATAMPVPSQEVGMRQFEEPERLRPGLRSTRSYLFDGGCVTYRFSFGAGATPRLMFEVDQALGFEPRQALVARVHEDSGLRLCGVGAPCAGGPAPWEDDQDETEDEEAGS
jgi:membrane-associated phospholipid phosphatase/serine/threonine protein kinase